MGGSRSNATTQNTTTVDASTTSIKRDIVAGGSVLGIGDNSSGNTVTYQTADPEITKQAFGFANSVAGESFGFGRDALGTVERTASEARQLLSQANENAFRIAANSPTIAPGMVANTNANASADMIGKIGIGLAAAAVIGVLFVMFKNK